jgi:polyadenylate-binding protein
MNGTELKSGSTLRVTKYEPKARGHTDENKDGAENTCSTKFTNLYVKNFPIPNFDENNLMRIFSKYGEITSVKIVRDENNQPKGFGFVCFKTSESARAALGENIYSQKECPNGFYVCQHQSKEERQMEIQKKSLNFKKSMQL